MPGRRSNPTAPVDAFKNALKENPKIALKMLEEVAARLRDSGPALNG